MKRMLSLILCLVLATGMLPLQIRAQEETGKDEIVAQSEENNGPIYTEGTLYYMVENDSATITGCSGTDEVVTIPSSVGDGIPVNFIASGAFTSNAYVKQVNVPDSIVSWPEDAFNEGIVIKRSVANVNDIAYYSMADAIEAAKTSNSNVVLMADVSESFSIPQGYITTIELNNHTLESEAITVEGNLTITGYGNINSMINGDFTAGENSIIAGGYYNGSITASSAFIMGGYFTNDPANLLIEGYGVFESDKEGYAYKVAKIIATVYVSAADDLIEKMKEASGDLTIELEDDIDLGSSYLTMNAGDITLNLNGKTISSSATQVIDLKGGNLVINDSGEGKIIGGQRAIIIRNNNAAEDGSANSKVIINGGYYEGTNYAIYANQGVDMTINGGEFKATNEIEGRPYAAIRLFCIGTFTITGGTFNGLAALRSDYENDEGKGVTTTITGGIFNGNVTSSKGVIYIYGGDFSVNVNGFCAEGYTAKSLESGRYVVEKTCEGDDVAILNGVRYKSLKEAINVANEEDTIALLENVEDNITIEEGKNIILDLNGYILSSASGTTITNKGIIEIENTDPNCSSNIKSGTIEGCDCIDNYGNMILGNRISLSGFYNVYNEGNLEYNGSSMGSAIGLYMTDGTAILKEGSNAYGDEGIFINGGNLIIEGGKVTGTSQGIEAEGGNITVNGGTISGNYAGIFLNNCESFNMTDGTVYGYGTDEAYICRTGVGIAIKGGIVNISGGTISGYGQNNASTEAKSDGYSQTGDAILIEGNDEEKTIKVSITDGTFTSRYAHDLGAYFSNVNSKPCVEISNGKFKTGNGKVPIYTGNDFDGTIEVSGGLFSYTFDSSLLKREVTFGDNTDTETSTDYPYTLREKEKYTITTTSKLLDENGKEISCKAAVNQGSGSYLEGDSVTLSSKVLSKYAYLNPGFAGWYKNEVSDANLVSNESTLTFTLDESANYIAVYKANRNSTSKLVIGKQIIKYCIEVIKRSWKFVFR